MRAREFIAEQKGKIPKIYHQASKGLRTFANDSGQDRIYELNRVMMAAAMADGTLSPVDMNDESWVGRHNVAAPYTAEEDNMMRVALAAVGSQHRNLNNGDLRSQELDSVNRTSPVAQVKPMTLGRPKKSKK